MLHLSIKIVMSRVDSDDTHRRIDVYTLDRSVRGRSQRTVTYFNFLISATHNVGGLFPFISRTVCVFLIHALAIYSEASKAYEFYAANFSDREEAKEALRFAAIFRQGLGQLDQAIKTARSYMKIIGRSDPAKSAWIAPQG